MRPAVFLDRDDTLIEDTSYTADTDRVRLLPGAADAVKRLNEAGLLVVVATNQSGVARGYFTEEQLDSAHDRMRRLLADHGAKLDGIYACPFLDGPEAVVPAYRRVSDLRKPAPGMLLLAAQEMEIELEQSWMIGDGLRDVEAGHAAGCRTILLSTRQDATMKADYVVANIGAAADIVLAAIAITDANTAAVGDHVHVAEVAMDRGVSNVLEDSMTSVPQRHMARTQPPAATDGNGRGGAVQESLQARTSPVRAGDGPNPDAVDGEQGRVLDTAARELLHEVRQWRRESRRQDFTAGHIVGVVAQSLAVAFVAWGLYAMLESKADAMVRLMAAVFFQVAALTYRRR